MKLLRIATFTGLLLATSIAAAQAPGTGITGSRHDWGGSAVTTDPLTGAKAGGTTVWYYFQGNPLNADGTVKTTLPAISTHVSAYPVYGVLATQNATTGAWTYSGDPAKVIPVQNPDASWTYNGGAGVAQATDRIQIGQCTRCHTPHRAKSTTLLWNHTLPTTQYSWNAPTTTAGTNFAQFTGDTYKGSTAKCLSCHDGTLSSTDGMWFNRTFNTSAKHVSSNPDATLNKNVTQNGVAGGNLSGMHPVAMPYPFAGQGSTYNGVTSKLATADGDGLAIAEWISNPTSKGIRLFKDDGTGNITAGAAAGKAGIECQSCHDVHNGARVKDVRLVAGKLGGKAADGYICQSCHNK